MADSTASGWSSEADAFRTLRPREGTEHTRAFEFLEVIGEDATPIEQLDLAGLKKGAHR